MRVKSPRRQRHNKIMKLAKGYRMARGKHYKAAREAVLHAGQYAYAGRRLRRRDKRSEWITQINAALTHISLESNQPKLSYSKFIAALKGKNITIDRKILAQLTLKDITAFKNVVAAVSA